MPIGRDALAGRTGDCAPFAPGVSRVAANESAGSTDAAAATAGGGEASDPGANPFAGRLPASPASSRDAMVCTDSWWLHLGRSPATPRLRADNVLATARLRFSAPFAPDRATLPA